MKNREVEIVMLCPDEVLVDREHAVQRGLVDSHVKSIAKEYSIALFGLGHVSRRGDGQFYLMDGQHRCAAAIVADQGKVPVPFRVWRGLSIAQEAEMFRKLQDNRKPVSAIDMFKIGIEAQNPLCVEVQAVVASFKLHVNSGTADGAIGAVGALLQIYEGKVRTVPKKPFPKNLPKSHLLSRTLTILTKAWGRDRMAFDGTLLKSVAAFIYKHDARVDGTRLSNALAKRDSPARSVGKIKALKEAARVSAVVAGVQYLEGLYNLKLSEEKKLR